MKETLNDRTSLLFTYGLHEILYFPPPCKRANRTWSCCYSKKRGRLRHIADSSQKEKVSRKIYVNLEFFFFSPPQQAELALMKNSVKVVNQNGSRFLHLKQTHSRTSAAKSRNGYLWIRKLQKSQDTPRLVISGEVKRVILKKKLKRKPQNSLAE